MVWLWGWLGFERAARTSICSPSSRQADPRRSSSDLIQSFILGPRIDRTHLQLILRLCVSLHHGFYLTTSRWLLVLLLGGWRRRSSWVGGSSRRAACLLRGVGDVMMMMRSLTGRRPRQTKRQAPIRSVRGECRATRDPFQLLLLGAGARLWESRRSAHQKLGHGRGHARKGALGDRSIGSTDERRARARGMSSSCPESPPFGCRFAGGSGLGQRQKGTPVLSEVVSAWPCASHAAHAHRFRRHWAAQARAVVGIRSKRGSFLRSSLLICLLAACRTPSLDDHPPIEPTRSTNTTNTTNTGESPLWPAPASGSAACSLPRPRPHVGKKGRAA